MASSDRDVPIRHLYASDSVQGLQRIANRMQNSWLLVEDKDVIHSINNYVTWADEKLAEGDEEEAYIRYYNGINVILNHSNNLTNEIDRRFFDFVIKRSLRRCISKCESLSASLERRYDDELMQALADVSLELEREEEFPDFGEWISPTGEPETIEQLPASASSDQQPEAAELVNANSNDRTEHTQQSRCIICMENVKVMMCVPCNHVVYCRDCKEAAVRGGSSSCCPMCRQHVASYTRIFM